MVLSCHKGPHLSTPSTVVISDFFHPRLRLGGDLQPQGVYSVCSSRPAFPTGPSVCWGGGGGGGGQQASGLSSTHKLWNFHRYSLVLLNISSIKCHIRARFGENVAELLLILYMCINHIETESRYHIYSILYTRFIRQSTKSL